MTFGSPNFTTTNASPECVAPDGSRGAHRIAGRPWAASREVSEHMFDGTIQRWVRRSSISYTATGQAFPLRPLKSRQRDPQPLHRLVKLPLKPLQLLQEFERLLPLQ